jgi:hypothetical protein
MISSAVQADVTTASSLLSFPSFMMLGPCWWCCCWCVDHLWILAIWCSSVSNQQTFLTMPWVCRSPSFNPPAGRRPAFYSNFDWLRRTNHVLPSPFGGRITEPPPRWGDDVRTSWLAARKNACWARLGRHIDYFLKT